MRAADYRLVRSQVTAGVTMGIRQSVVPKAVDHYFSYWLYGQRKSATQIPVDLARVMPCLVCSEEDRKTDDVSLLNVDVDSFLECLPLFDKQQLSILYALLDDDRQVFEHAVRQQYESYRRALIECLRGKMSR